MKIPSLLNHKNARGYALVIVLALTSISLFALSGALTWTSNNALLNDKNNVYFSTLAAAEASTEKVISMVATDYRKYGEAGVWSRMSDYRNVVPTVAENPWWANYEFNNAQGGANQTHVERTSSWGYVELQSQYKGLNGMAATYRIVSNARDISVRYPATAGIRQDIQVASIPLFQFAIFYSLDLEINPGATMTVDGRVHGNQNLYTEPNGVTLTFEDHVTSVGSIISKKKAGDGSNRSKGTIVYNGEHDGGVSTLALPIGTNNTPDAVREVIKVPPAGEDRTTGAGRERYYNKADLVILVTDAGVTAKSGAEDEFATTIPWTEAGSFVKTNVNFFNKRENKTIKATEVDIAALNAWSTTNSTLRARIDKNVSILYVADQRSQTATTQSGVRLVNGQTLLDGGLTVATENPLYVKGHYNAPAAYVGTTNTLFTKPASLVSDAITILSSAWNDANGGLGLTSRIPVPTTVNAAILSGIRETDTTYSGGVENFPRFLENWSSRKFHYNGSMVAMFPSAIAKAAWGGPEVYSAPQRVWTFDKNFKDATKLPPGTPQLLTIIRGEWAIANPGQTY